MTILANPVELEHFLEDAPFPSSKQRLVDYAREHDVKASMIVSLEKLPEREYRDARDAATAAWEAEEVERGTTGGADSPDDE